MKFKKIYCIVYLVMKKIMCCDTSKKSKNNVFRLGSLKKIFFFMCKNMESIVIIKISEQFTT
jgi:hypothetical protein